MNEFGLFSGSGGGLGAGSASYTILIAGNARHTHNYRQSVERFCLLKRSPFIKVPLCARNSSALAFRRPAIWQMPSVFTEGSTEDVERWLAIPAFDVLHDGGLSN
jgi:hypothetical protein